MQSGQKPCPGISCGCPRRGHGALAPVGQTGLLAPSIYLCSRGPRGSRLAGILRPAVSGDSASQGSVAPGLCVLSGWALRGGGGWEWSTTQERLEPGFHSGESWVLPAPTTVTWKTMSQLVYWPSLLAQTHKPCLTSWFSQLLLHLLQGVLHGQRGGPVVPDVLWGRGQRCHHCCLSLLRPWVLEAAPVPSGSRTGGQEKRWDAM